MDSNDNKKFTMSGRRTRTRREPEPAQDAPEPNLTQQMMNMLQEQGNMIQQMRAEINELRARQERNEEEGNNNNGNGDQEDIPEDASEPNLAQQMMNMQQEQGNMMQQIRAEINELRARQERNEEGNNNNGNGDQEEIPEEPQGNRDVETLLYWVSKFRKQNPPAFHGRFDAAEDWILRLEKIFQVLGCPEVRKAQLAIYKLEGDADRWWRNTETTLLAQNIPVTWELFQERFNEQYQPPSIRNAKEFEFLNIRQGESEPFEEYYTRFTRLSRYSAYHRNPGAESSLADILVRGLKYEIREKLIARQFHALHQAIEECRIVERNLRDLHALKNTSSRGESSRGNLFQKRKRPGFGRHGNNKKSSRLGQ